MAISSCPIKSQHLLLLSGIGPAPVLREHGIAKGHHSPGVGRHVVDHLGGSPSNAELATEPALDDWIRQNLSMSYHLSCSNRMGRPCDYSDG